MSNFTPQEIEQFLQEFFDTVGARQYVGARYVPLIGRRGEDDPTWDGSAPYEPLTVVTWQGDSYTSRQYVPAGVPLTNATYWARTSNYNAQIDAYRRETGVVREHVDTIAALLPESRFSTDNTVYDTIVGKIDDFAVVVNAQIAEAIGSITNDPPQFVSSTDAMTDQDVVYVLQNTGQIYAWNGTAFADTGVVYGQAGGTVIQAGIVTVANYASVLPDVNNVRTNTSYVMNISANATSFPANLPFSRWTGGVSELRTISAVNSGIGIQMLIQQNGFWIRVLHVVNHEPITSWTHIADDSVPLCAATQVNDSNYASVLPDANGAEPNTYHILNFGGSATAYTANLPNAGGVWANGNLCSLMTLGNDATSGLCTQLFQSVGNVYVRSINVGTDTEVHPWVPLRYGEREIILGHRTVNASTYATVLPDFNAVDPNSEYVINLSQGATSYPAHTPFANGWYGENLCVLMTYTSTNSYLSIQTLTSPHYVYTRKVNVSTQEEIEPWRLIAQDVKYDVYVTKQGSIPGVRGDRVYSSLTDAVYDAAVTYDGQIANVYVVDGSYDLVQEFTTKFGSLDTFNSASQFNGFARGLILKSFNVIGTANNTVTFDYTGSNSFVQSQLSVFTTALASDNSTVYRLEGLNIVASNIRYCVHDELGNATSTIKSMQRHTYRNCTMSIDNSANPSWSATQCIGGGMGTSEVVNVEACVFDTVGATDAPAVSYHNSLSALAQNHVCFRDNYVKNGTFRCSIYGQSQYMTTVTVSGNSMTAAPEKTTSGTAEEHPYDNVTMYAWDNEVRA